MTQTTTTSIRTHGLTRIFGDFTAVRGLDLELPSHGVIGFVGPNGSGKSTTIRMLLGLIKPTDGHAEVLGEPVSDPARYADRVGALIENPAFISNISGRANIESMALLRSVPSQRVDEVLEIVGLTDRADSKVSEYSLGMKQRLAIAIALLPDPELLILDEPTNGLDPAGIVEVRALIRQLADEGRTVVVSSHLLSEIEAAADHLVIIRYGELLFAGPLAELLEREQRYVDVEPEDPADLERLAAAYRAEGLRVEQENGGYRVDADPTESGRLNRIAAEAGILLRRVEPRSETLEDIFLSMTDGDAVSATDSDQLADAA
jgi:ABC-2 type transport system ATP-binding protein